MVVSNGNWGFARGQEDINSMGFWAINVDDVLVRVLGLYFLGSFFLGSEKSKTRCSGGLPNFCEYAVEFVENNVTQVFGARATQ